ncbi:discoidin domain-containing protein [Paenibacillus sp. NPDC057886]|uniref:discoidin domain-containing protein n=1 Tax=Paenibacillus sp. NPDC057886 TaxID=3346270 RepID=UPI0036B3CEC2
MAQYSGNIIPTMTSNTTPSPIVVSSSTQYSATFAPWKAFDGSFGTHWMTSAGVQGWVKIDLGSQKKLGRYSLSSSTDTPNLPVTANPKNWTLEGSNTGLFSGEQDVLHTVSNEQAWTPGLKRIYDFDNQKSYRYYRINITSNQGYANFMGFAELEMMELIISNKILLSSGDKVYSNKRSESTIIPTMTSNTSPSGRAFCSSFFDNLNSYDAWVAFNRIDDTEGYASGRAAGVSGYLGYEFTSKKVIRKYAIRSMSSSAYLNAMPKDWTFEGSEDGLTWIVLDTQTNQSWSTTNTDKEYIINNFNPYIMYRLNWTSNNGRYYTGFNELKMFDSKLFKINNASEGAFNRYGVDRTQDIYFANKIVQTIDIMDVSNQNGSDKTFEHTIDMSKRRVDKIILG